ncbi:pentatricopeptide repeat-containing protein [Prunus yedoensis var. nudiflora]|uniref:Pentatricopeptide repeat-containing protein n=1 Tax=Prunus yedoensis var. nudiflora TaxID=2094558 RepID=A0A314XHP1_PRUYE|nr:pentatricopeptide repeat-containing protein [Prunus yedoensis var. nudiflora]
MAAALRMFHEMPNHGCPPDSDTYVTLINGLCELGKIGEAKELFNEMETKGCLPSVVMYTSLIHGFCQTINLDEAVWLFEHMKTKCLYLQLFDGWRLCKGGRSSQAMELLDLMVSKRHKPNNITHSTLLHGCCEEGKLQEALKILDRMKLQGMKQMQGCMGK